MFRCCTIARYRSYFRKISNIKSLRSKDVEKELEILLVQVNKTSESSGCQLKIKKTNKIRSALEKYSRTLGLVTNSDKISSNEDTRKKNCIPRNVIGNEFRELSASANMKLILEYAQLEYQTRGAKRHKRKYHSLKYVKQETEKLCETFAKQLRKNKTFLFTAAAVSVVDQQSTTDTLGTATPTTSVATVVDQIPEPPPIPEGTEEVLNQLNALGEPTFTSLGLGGYTPVGLVQHCMEYLHVTLGIDWWAAIVLGTLIIRIALFPLVIIAQRNAARMNNYLPQMQSIQMKLTEARQTGNQIDAARYSHELMIFMKEKGLNPLKNMMVPLAQMPIFISFFVGLRQMANVPVESLRTGGLWWFTDLTLPDQYFLLPIVTSLTLWATIELGTDTARLSSQNMQMMKYVLRAMPLIVLPFTVNFPGAILCYWVSSNFISLVQVAFLKIPTIRDYFKIEPLVTHRPDSLPMKQKGFTEGIKDSWTNIKITKELEERRRLDELRFQRAGKGPIVKTYNYDPTKQVSPSSSNSSSPISAKKR